jgi:hypothetical protein
MVWSRRKNAKPRNAKTNCNNYNESKKGKEDDHIKTERDEVEEDLNTVRRDDRQ